MLRKLASSNLRSGCGRDTDHKAVLRQAGHEKKDLTNPMDVPRASLRVVWGCKVKKTTVLK